MSEWRPLVYIDAAALRQARELMEPNVVPELAIRDAIIAGHASVGRVGRVLDPGGIWVAHVERRPGKFRPRPRSWHVCAITRQEERHATHP
jgi:hypothetical protein